MAYATLRDTRHAAAVIYAVAAPFARLFFTDDTPVRYRYHYYALLPPPPIR